MPMEVLDTNCEAANCFVLVEDPILPAEGMNDVGSC